ncbi:hypothetical protein BN2497_8991 [Janthinobacterium sp. CG23_2]|nr:hypothetical protein BN2497_8991 [Janthinobacterium sp. CG23_2]CUU30893.1 hypothetical protein BN3177_8991 [Janthinobacterium sp. CG23_2]
MIDPYAYNEYPSYTPSAPRARNYARKRKKSQVQLTQTMLANVVKLSRTIFTCFHRGNETSFGENIKNMNYFR